MNAPSFITSRIRDRIIECPTVLLAQLQRERQRKKSTQLDYIRQVESDSA
jgi:hypothetical protein